MTEKIKRSLIFFLCLILLCTSSGFSVCAFASEKMLGEMRCNPCFAGSEPSYYAMESKQLGGNSVSKTYQSKTYSTDGVQLYKTVRDNLTARNESFEINYLSSSLLLTTGTVMNLIEDLIFAATEDELSESAFDGDYVRWSVYKYGFDNSSYYHSGSYYYYTINARCIYYDNAREEAEVDRVIDEFVSSINTNELTDYQIIKKVHDFICSKTTYDYDAQSSIDSNKYALTAYGALVKGKSICQGYSVAFYRLCKELGYSARFVSSPTSAIEMGHAWNMVMLDGKYYFVDVTWDDGYLERNSNRSYSYFLVSYDDLRKNDSVLKEHTLDNKYYGSDYFAQNYFSQIDESNYNADNKNLISQSIVAVSQPFYIYSGSENTPQINVSSSGYPEAYSVSYSNNVNTGVATANICSQSGLVLSQRRFLIIPRKMSAPFLADSGRNSDSLKIKWSSAPHNVSGYCIEIYKNGEWQLFKMLSAEETSLKCAGLNAATKYRFRIRSYLTVSNKDYFGEYSNVYITATKPKKPKIISVSSKSKKITAKIKKVNCSGYELKYSTNKSMKGAKTINISASSTSAKTPKLKKNTRYYFKVRAYKSYTSASGKKCKCYSSWSSKKSIVCK